MEDHAPAAPFSNEDEAALEDDVACHGCGYNLRGLCESKGRCPECGAPVWVSCIDDSLQYADPKWVALIARGADGAVLSLVGAAVCIGVGVGLLTILEGRWNPSSRALLWMLILTITPWAIWFLISLWRFSTPEPGRTEIERAFTPRRLIRIGLLAVPATFALASVAYWSPIPTWIYGVILALGAPVGVIGMAATVALTRSVEDLARRSGDDEAPKSAAFYGMAYRVSWGFAAFGLLFLTGATPLACFVLLGGAGMLLFGALALILPHRITTGMEQQLSRSQRNWQFVKWIAPNPRREPR